MSLPSPERSSPSKSKFRALPMHGGTEFFLEVRDTYEDAGFRRIGELVLWRGPDDSLTIRTYSA